MISVIVPVYNVEGYLNECIESVRRLTCNWEAILVDDGSTDSSGEICDKWEELDSRIHTIHRENGGLSAARNTGIKHASGDYILLLDSDDFLDPEQTDKMLDSINSGSDVIVGLYREYYQKENRFKNESCGGLLALHDKTDIDSFLAAIPEDGRSCYMVAWRFVVKRSFILENNLLFMQGIYHEDEEWTCRLLCAAFEIYVTHYYFYQYRQDRAGAITSKVKPKHIWDRFIIIDSINNLLQSLETDNVKCNYLKKRMAQLYLSNMIDWRILNKEESSKANDKLAEYRTTCVPNMKGKVGRPVKAVDAVFGTKICCRLLAVAHRVIFGREAAV